MLESLVFQGRDYNMDAFSTGLFQLWVKSGVQASNKVKLIGPYYGAILMPTEPENHRSLL